MARKKVVDETATGAEPELLAEMNKADVNEATDEEIVAAEAEVDEAEATESAVDAASNEAEASPVEGAVEVQEATVRPISASMRKRLEWSGTGTGFYSRGDRVYARYLNSMLREIDPAFPEEYEMRANLVYASNAMRDLDEARTATLRAIFPRVPLEATTVPDVKLGRKEYRFSRSLVIQFFTENPVGVEYAKKLNEIDAERFASESTKKAEARAAASAEKARARAEASQKKAEEAAKAKADKAAARAATALTGKRARAARAAETQEVAAAA